VIVNYSRKQLIWGLSYQDNTIWDNKAWDNKIWNKIQENKIWDNKIWNNVWDNKVWDNKIWDNVQLYVSFFRWSTCSQRFLNHLGFLSFYYEHTSWRLFFKHVGQTFVFTSYAFQQSENTLKGCTSNLILNLTVIGYK
jgi:hypothetical protein